MAVNIVARVSIAGFVLLVGLSGLSAVASEQIRENWMHLEPVEDHVREAACDYFYFPGGGMRTLYCYFSQFLDYRSVGKLAGMRVFVRGPHSHRKLDLANKYDFGYYNPDFVTWLKDNAIPGASDAAFRQLTQQIYDDYLKERATIYHATYIQLQKDPTFLEREKETYLAHLRNRTLPTDYHTRSFTFGGLALQYDGNLVSTALFFWIRRSIDGTAPLFFEGLEKLRTTYET